MTRVMAVFFTLLMVTISLAGCLDSGDSEQEVYVCSEIDFTTHEITVSYLEYELERSYVYPEYGNLIVKNSDLIYFENTTQVLSNGQIYDIHPQGSAILETHTRFQVYYNEDNEDSRIITNNGDTVCLIENPNIDRTNEIFLGQYGRCTVDSYRLENGSYEHAEPMCNHILTEHLDGTSTIRGGVENVYNILTEGYDSCFEAADVFNIYNGDLVGLNYTVERSWGHFSEGKEFRIHYNGVNESYHKSYFLKELREDVQSGVIYSRGIDTVQPCNIAFVQLYADKNLTEPASLDRNLTTDDVWEVIAEGCTFYRSNFHLGTAEMPIIHACDGMVKGTDWAWLVNNVPNFDLNAAIENENNTNESAHEFFKNFTQTMITKNYSEWHNMLADEVHAINSNTTYQKTNLTESFFENFTDALGTIQFANASIMDLSQNHWQLIHTFILEDPNPTFNWSFDPIGSLLWEVDSPMAESALMQDRIYNHTGWGYDGMFFESTGLKIMTWVPGPYTTPLLNEYLLTIVVDRNEDGSISIVGMADYTVEVSR